MPRFTSHASDTGVSLRHFPRPTLLPRDINHLPDRRFFHAWSFSQSASGKNIAGVSHDTLVSTGFFQLHLWLLSALQLTVCRAVTAV